MDDLVLGVIIGAVAAAVLMAGLHLLLTRRQRRRHRDEVRRFEESVLDLRQERAEDKETNRRLRHELAAKSPDRLIETANTAELERDGAFVERDQAVEQLEVVQGELAHAQGRLQDRETKLREYREALKEIRISLEAQDRVRSMQAADRVNVTDTDELQPDVALAAGLAAPLPPAEDTVREAADDTVREAAEETVVDAAESTVVEALEETVIDVTDGATIDGAEDGEDADDNSDGVALLD